jgi:hypothetical protein
MDLGGWERAGERPHKQLVLHCKSGQHYVLHRQTQLLHQCHTLPACSEDTVTITTRRTCQKTGKVCASADKLQVKAANMLPLAGYILNELAWASICNPFPHL